MGFGWSVVGDFDLDLDGVPDIAFGAGFHLSAGDLDLDGAADLLNRGDGAPGRLWVVLARP